MPDRAFVTVVNLTADARMLFALIKCPILPDAEALIFYPDGGVWTTDTKCDPEVFQLTTLEVQTFREVDSNLL